MRNAILSVLLFAAAQVQAQFTPAEPRTESHLLKFSILAPGIEYERSLTRFTTLNAYTGLSPSGAYTSETGFQYFLNPTVQLQYRYYYNMKSRQARGKNTAFNSANYLALHLEATGSSIISNSEDELDGNYGAAVVWGFQRVYKSGLYLGGHVGPGIKVDASGKAGFFIHSGLRFGIVFKNRNAREEAEVRRLEQQDVRMPEIWAISE